MNNVKSLTEHALSANHLKVIKVVIIMLIIVIYIFQKIHNGQKTKNNYIKKEYISDESSDNSDNEYDSHTLAGKLKKTSSYILGKLIKDLNRNNF